VPRDSEGYQCGQDSEVIDQKYLFFFDLAKCADPLVPLNGCKTTQTCIKECPKKTFFHDMSVCNSQGVANYKKDLICTRQVDLSIVNTCNAVNKLMDEEKCSKWYLKSESCKFIVEFPLLEFLFLIPPCFNCKQQENNLEINLNLL
jgi:solute carrier family 44 (choline transporter-like protein), member 2/4/5